MTKVDLLPHNKKYAKLISSLSSAPQIKDALGLTSDQTSLKGTIGFIKFVMEQEKLGKQLSRVIFNENNELIGVITLKDIDTSNKTCHIGTWIGHQYWEKGYNQLAKSEILYTAFTDLCLVYVFAGARTSNIRSLKAQEKLPYIKVGVESEFPVEHTKLEIQANEPCILNVIEKDTFLKWYDS